MQRALYVVCGALAGYSLFGAPAVFGMAAVVVNLLTPLPAVYLGMRFGVAWGWLTILLTALLILVATGPTPLLMYLLQFGLPAGALFWLLLRKTAWDRAVIAALGVMVAASLFGVFAVSVVQNTSPVMLVGAVIEQEVTQATATMQGVFADAEMPPAELKEVNQALARMADFMREVYAGLAIVVGMFMLLSQILVLSIVGRNNFKLPGVPFAKWKAPEPLIWILILAGFVALFAEGVLRTFGLNLLVVLLPIYFLQGLAVVDNFFRRKALSPMIRTVGYLLLVLINPLPMLVACVGVFDLWVDFRKPRIPKSS